MKHFLIHISVDNSPVLQYFSKFLSYHSFFEKKNGKGQIQFETVENGLVLIYPEYGTFVKFNEEIPTKDISLKSKVLASFGGLAKLVIPSPGINILMKPYHGDFSHFYQEILKYFSNLHEKIQITKQEIDVLITMPNSEAVIAFFNDFFKRYSNVLA